MVDRIRGKPYHRVHKNGAQDDKNLLSLVYAGSLRGGASRVKSALEDADTTAQVNAARSDSADWQHGPSAVANDRDDTVLAVHEWAEFLGSVIGQRRCSSSFRGGGPISGGTWD